MRKNLILPAILILLAIGSGVFYFMKGNPDEVGMDISDRQFSIQNTEEVGVISIERKDYPKVIFTKKGEGWEMNNGRMARPEATGYILNTMKKLTIKYIPNQLGSERIREAIRKEGIKVMIFDRSNELMKSFYIGPDLGDGTGTAFLMEGAQQPFVLFTRGFESSIRTRFVFDMNEYETKDIFREDPAGIQEVEIKYPFDKPSSFTLKKKLIGWDFFNPYTQTRLPSLNEKLIEPYLEGYKTIIAEYNDANNPNKEMILRQPVFCEIRVSRKDGSTRSATLYSLANIEFKQNKYSPKEVGPDNRFMVYTDKKEFFLIQHRVIGKLLLAYDSFAKR
ncbi:MAG: hypothetical protein IPN29_15075 [Saprospiraceae bacterium]|nr:hypothetical protein [Saprospiraceae bacterium]